MNLKQRNAVEIQAKYRTKLDRLLACSQISGKYTKEKLNDLYARKTLSPESRAWIDSMILLYQVEMG